MSISITKQEAGPAPGTEQKHSVPADLLTPPSGRQDKGRTIFAVRHLGVWVARPDLPQLKAAIRQRGWPYHSYYSITIYPDGSLWIIHRNLNLFGTGLPLLSAEAHDLFREIRAAAGLVPQKAVSHA
jgi:hypothetical protein